VIADIKNATSSSLFLKVRVDGKAVAQVSLADGETQSLRLDPDEYETVMKIDSRYYKGPMFQLPPNTARASLILRPSQRTNLEEIDASQFAD
jgi:hypothetical protein